MVSSYSSPAYAQVCRCSTYNSSISTLYWFTPLIRPHSYQCSGLNPLLLFLLLVGSIVVVVGPMAFFHCCSSLLLGPLHLFGGPRVDNHRARITRGEQGGALLLFGDGHGRQGLVELRRRRSVRSSMGRRRMGILLVHDPQFFRCKANPRQETIRRTHHERIATIRPGRVDQVGMVNPRHDRQGMVTDGIVDQDRVPRQDGTNRAVGRL